MAAHNTTLSAATHGIHADDRVSHLTDVAPPIHTSTTFRYPRNVNDLVPVPDSGEHVDLSTPLVYSRLASANTNRLETLLTPLIFPEAPPSEHETLGNHIVTYTSGLSAFHALLTHLVPKVIAISGGYHGCHGVIDLHKRLHNVKVVDLHGSDSEWKAAGMGPGDLVHVETPLNPTGEALFIENFASRAHSFGAELSVDATFGPPGLQDPFQWGADFVMHSGTKYIGGHSDMLCGVLATAKGEDGLLRAKKLRDDRIFLGSVLGSLEGWLGVRSLRTLELRVQRQSANATRLVGWLNECKEDSVKRIISKVTHASLQQKDMRWLQRQMPNGYGPVFAIYTQESWQARKLPSLLHLFHHATSLGGVESLIEWRRMSDTGVDEKLLRVSVGVEGWEDLKNDLLQAFEKLAEGQEVDSSGGNLGVQTGGEGAKQVRAADGAV